MRYLLLALCLGLTACSNTSSSFIVSPQVFWNQSNELKGAEFSLQVVDQRNSEQTLFLRDGAKVNSRPTSNNLAETLEISLTNAFQAQGAQVVSSSPTSITVQIIRLNADADQRTVEHLVKNDVELKLIIENSAGSFDKAYAGKSSFSGPFKLDTAVAEGKLRVLTEQVLAELLKDQSWHSYAKG
ncbi:YajG family lipoprotein [Rheinheimera sp.]|uniref:YajG family lipoprotein n=1 Tax=Rheinheimera sp. TaxID=1869214 RepID=UPI003AF47606